MQLILEQTFPLGRFHATPWKVFPYDDPHGEWPPSPWRLVRAVLARSYQLDREIADSAETHATLRESLVRAFATSDVEWLLPPSSWRGPGLRQYQPADFRFNPSNWKEKKLPGFKGYNTTKVLDNFWVTTHGAAAPVFWQFDGPDWTPPLVAHLDACLARMTYFGRAESITEIRRIETTAALDMPVKLSPRRSSKAVPVLALQMDATLAQLEATTDAASVKDTNIPPGSRWMYAERPPRPQVRPAKRPMPELPDTNLIQFAIGSNVAPRYKDAVRITERFRDRAIRSLERIFGVQPNEKWISLDPDVARKLNRFAGRDSDGSPARGHSHASFLLCGDASTPSRLCVWRREPFCSDEQRAILDASRTPLPLSHRDDPWTITLVPLDKLVPPPPGLAGESSASWKSLTPFIPPRHVYDRKGRVKDECSVKEQIERELLDRYGVKPVAIEEGNAVWAKIHQKVGKGSDRTNTDKRGYEIRLTFDGPLAGPICLGGASHFGLGLFVPVWE